MAGSLVNKALVGETRIQLSDQFGRLEAFRSKSFTALASSGVISAFFAGRVASVSTGLKIAGIASFAVTALAAILIAVPRKTSQGIGPATYKAWADEHGDEELAIDSFLAGAARDVVASWQNNESKVALASYLFLVQCVALTAQLCVWLAILASG